MLASVCLALAMYYEARGDGPVGMVSSGQVVLNRVADPRYPKDVCSVVQQGGYKTLHKCQFSFYCDGKSETPRDKSAWDEAQKLAAAMLSGIIASPKLSQATCYHNHSVKPTWTYTLRPITVVGSHIFYRC